MAYYHDLITEKSWKRLQELNKKHKFVLIGGWAVYLYTRALKSRDIDFICSYEELEKLKKQYDLVKNDRLRKYEIHMGEFDVDVYVPFFSDLAIPVEDLQIMTRIIDGFHALMPEALLILKQKAYGDRAASLKGEKDRIDIIALLNGQINFEKYRELLKKYGLSKYKTALRQILLETHDVKELSLSKHAFAKLKKEIIEML